MNKEQVAVIGAGITGLYLSWRLQQRGFETTVFEKKRQNEIGTKPCSSLISERIRNFIPIPNDLFQRKVESVLVHFPKKDIRIKPKPPFLLFERKELDNFVFSLAQRAGVRFVFEREISEPPQEFSKVIGCDGALSETRKLLALPSPSFRLGVQYFIKADSPCSEIEIWPKIFNGFPRYGFFWKIPKTGTIEYGGIGPSSLLKKEFEKFCQRHKSKAAFDQPGISKAALVPQGICLPDSGNITLVGDAAGLTKPTTGGGVIWGLTAADILNNNFSDFGGYKKEIKKFFKPKISKGKLEVSLGYFLGNHFPFVLPKEIFVDADLF